MYIESVRIGSFGGLDDFSLELTPGLNIVEGCNESGKSTVCAFIRFMFYGFGGRSEKSRFLSWKTGMAGGTLTLNRNGERFRIERRSTAASDEVSVTELKNNAKCFKGKTPGEVFLGVPASVFDNTVYVGQLGGGRVDGAEIGEAVGNILYSADESVNLQRALKRIDEARIQLLYKNKKGGRIYELEGECEGLRQRLARASESNAAIIAKEGMIADIKAKLESNRGKLAGLKLILDAYEASVSRSRKNNIEELSQRVAELAAAKDGIKADYSFGDFLPDGAYAEQLKTIRAELEVTRVRLEDVESELAAHTETEPSQRQQDPRRAAIDLMGGPEAVDGNFTELKLKRRSMLAFAVIFGILFIPAAVVTVIILLINTAYGVIGAVGALALLFGMVMCFITSSRYGRQLDGILDTTGIADEKELYALLESEEEPDAPDNTAMLLEAERAKLQKIYSEKLAAADELAGRWGRNGVDDALDDYNEYNRKLLDCDVEAGKYGAALENAKKQFSALVSDGGTEEGTAESGGQALPEGVDIKAVSREYDFISKAVLSQNERVHTLELELAQLGARQDRPSELGERITAAEAEAEKLRKRHDAYMLAHEKLEAAGAGLRDSLSPRLSECAGRVMSAATAGKYDTLGVDRNMDMTFNTGSGGELATRDYSAMSAGTRDLAYIALRMAMTNVLYRSSAPPLIFDESFVRLDDFRLRDTLRFLAANANSGTQVIILTAQTREYSAAGVGAKQIKI